MNQLLKDMTHRFKTRFVAMAFALLWCGFGLSANAQRVVNVDPGYGTLNEAIAADANVDEAVFVLQRGQEYILSETIRYEGQILRVYGAEGDGPRPVIYPGVDLTGQSGNHFQTMSDLELKNVVIRGVDDLGADVRNPIRPAGDSVRIVVDNSVLETSGQSFVRFDAPGMSFFLTNSVVRNSGITDSPGNGRLVDTRGNDADTIWVQNSTIYQNLAEHVRVDGSFIRYFLWDHNTSMNIGITTLNLGRALEATISNSIIANPYGRGDDDPDNPIMTIDSLVNAYGYTDDDRKITFKNLTWFETPELQAGFPDTMRTSMFFDSLFTPFIDAGIVDTSNIFVEQLEFANPPPHMIEYGKYVFDGGTSDYPRWRAYETEEMHTTPTVLGDLPENTFNFSYPETSRAYSAGSAGLPLGDLNWFPGMIDEWLATDIERGRDDLPDRLRLDGNYPNPFNPTTTIRFDLPAAAEVNVVLFDVLGRQVMELAPMKLAAGNGHQVRVDAGSLPSGIYLYQVRATTGSDLTVRTGQMVLIK